MSLAIIAVGALLLIWIICSALPESSESQETAGNITGQEQKKVTDGNEADNLTESKELLENAIDTLLTADQHLMMEEGVVPTVPNISAGPEELDKMDDNNAEKWHYYEYLDWNQSADAEFPQSSADGQKGKRIIMILHGNHAWTECFQEAFQKCANALNMTVEFMDPNWSLDEQNKCIEQAIAGQPDAIGLIPISTDASEQQFKKITNAGIPAFCINTKPSQEAMNYIIAFTGPDEWQAMRNLADELGRAMGGRGGVAYITYNEGATPYYPRYYGAVTELSEKYPLIKNLDEQAPGFDREAVRQAVAEMIDQFGDELNAIILSDDSDQAIGAVKLFRIPDAMIFCLLLRERQIKAWNY